MSDEGSGAGPPASPLERGVDLAEVNDPLADNSLNSAPEFDQWQFQSSCMDHSNVTAHDNWVFSMIGIKFRFKDMELEDEDVEFIASRPSSLFIIDSVIVYDGETKGFSHLM